ncbi:hypothetical protein VE25_04985 [Devosia geojensis]|uniref:Uncharacterized protein n=1 Tax=Devosia geojensis TaxID=443610 RepID=A0A0F5FXJ5_9HYPH|nr:hypothetical protein [Devosia geojensis]KKB12912.1 hypothetical protein VE25_04985 [Devosia geojensis]
MKLVFPAVLFTAALVAPAHAYLDPGTGSMILQAIVGAVAVAGATLSVYWGKVKSLFSRKKQ